MAPKHLCFSSLGPYEIKTESQTKTFEAAFTQNVAVLHIFGVVMNVILAIIDWSVVKKMLKYCDKRETLRKFFVKEVHVTCQ